ncbi:hypothetical protein C8D88_10951 [Lentzea atacamensis]|uniref:34 kDa antigenic protein n=2 Tax=Lentzea TaxID=165301 RepID=A0A316HRS8_9PSEU|nr:DUF5336 domain-containing protein [Lentzea atacamensis]PWK83971.1 hypothetical protein C8D88_10951 [Lentzea atacamensis]RAS68835.1 hypothetical protein C8D87_102908 [Lentzea atacamensis]
MSVPYGAPQQQPPGPAQHQAPHQAPGAPGANNINLGLILPLVAAGLGLVAYLVAFADDVSGNVTYLLAAGMLAGLSVLPSVPKGFVPVGAVLAAVQTLLQLQGIIKSPSVQGLDIVLLIVALLETAAIVLAFLLAEGIVKFEPKPANPYGGQPGQPGGWNPQSGAFPQQGQHPQQHAPQQQAPQQFGQQQFGQQPQQPAQPGQPPQQTSFMPQPGQFGSPGTPPGGFGGPQQ